jgi:hypothetical protein
MALPTYVVELSFGSSGYVDVSQYVQSVSISRGITRTLDDFPAGSVSITFVNNARVFDPLNTSSPLWYGAGGYTMVQPGGRLRVSSNSIRVFTGFVQGWEFSFGEAGLDGQATVLALDEIFKINNLTFDAGTEAIVQDTGSRIQKVLNYAGFGASEYSGVAVGKTVIGADVHASGDSVLAYLQNVARSEPADFYSNASAVMQLEDRSFANLTWTNTTRNNLIKYPNELSQDTTVTSLDGGTGLGDGWIYGWQPGTAATYFTGGTVNTAEVTLSTRDFYYQEVNQNKINPDGTATKYIFSGWFRGQGLTGAGISGNLTLLDSTAASLVAQSMTASAASGNTWTQMTGTAIYTGASTVAGFRVAVSSPGTTSTYNFIGNGWQVERGTVIGSYFDGTYNPFTSTASTAYVSGSTVNNVGWSGLQWSTDSGLVTSTAASATAPVINYFADVNSQSSVGSTAIPFMDLGVVYGGERLYNSIQVVGINAVSSASDTALISRYGLREYAQQDNLTTSLTRTAEIASKYLDAYKYPEYRAEQITVALEALTSAQQNLVLAIELRDVVRVLFKPSNTGAVVDKYYEVLGVDSQIDTERHHITFRVASLENLGLSF